MSGNEDTEAATNWLGSPAALAEILAIEDDDERHETYLNPWQLLLGELTLYGQTEDFTMVGMLRLNYEIVVDLDRSDIRVAIYERLLEGVLGGELNACVFLPFIGYEPEATLASRAVIDYCMTIPGQDDPPNTGMRIVGRILRSGQALNRGAVFGGLLCLGDRRAHDELLRLKVELEPHEVDQAVRIRTGFLSAATIEFYLDWMEERRRDFDDRTFGALAAGMVNQIIAARVPMVMTGSRAIPPGAMPRATEEKLEAWIPLADYARQIEPRLRALDAVEQGPKVMPMVLEAWGLGAKR